MAVQLRQVVEARQGHAELRAQPFADLGLDVGAAGQQAQPQAQRMVVVAGHARFQADALVVEQRGDLLADGALHQIGSLTAGVVFSAFSRANSVSICVLPLTYCFGHSIGV